MEFFIILIFVSALSFFAGIIASAEYSEIEKRPPSDSNVNISFIIEARGDSSNTYEKIVGSNYFPNEYNVDTVISSSNLIDIKKYNQIGVIDGKKE